MNYQIDIDGSIGTYGYSKYYIKQMLDQYKGQPVNVRVNSLGGSLDDALDIAARFNEHGDVTVFMFGYCASAATVLALGAKKTVIDENAFYLVHKVMNWVDIWDTLNADQLQDLIDELEKNKRDNEKMDLVLAKMYAKKSGHTANEIMAVLKEAVWLTADEAKNWGFVDEIGTGLKYAPAAIENKLNAFGLPLPKPRENKLSAIDKIKNMFNKNVSAMLTNYLNLNALLKVEGFEDKENSVSMTADQLTAIDNELKANAAAIESLKADNEAKENTIKELQEKVAALENLPGDETKHVEPEVDNAVSAASMYENIKNLI